MFPSPRRAVFFAAAPLIFLYHLLARIFWSGLNGRTIFTLPLNFAVNFLPIYVWLLIFKNAGMIPKSIRPAIHVALAYRVDSFMFARPMGSVLTVAVSTAGAWLLYVRFFCAPRPKYAPLAGDGLLPSLSLADLELEVLGDLEQQKGAPPGDFQDHPHIGALEFFSAQLPRAVAENAAAINAAIALHVSRTRSHRPYNAWAWAPAALVAASWFLLNAAHWFATPLSVARDAVSWFSYVLGHFCVPLFTGIWLYVFHAPGALRLFSCALGAQNIAGVLTHLVFPNAPPWFIHMKGVNGHADYDTPGYAAGLTRAPFGTGAHLVTQGFHASPIVFGALPSLHSAMAVMCFFFVCYYARWTAAKIALFMFVVIQWWSTIYLDHHWRLDLFAGMLYSVALFVVFYTWGMPSVDERFIAARREYDFQNGSTMGMRVFRNTVLQNFFDPLS